MSELHPSLTGRASKRCSPAQDAIVIGAGPNGLVAAIVLADAGWSVLVLEANDEPGGAVRSGSITSPGFVNDLYSAFYPLTAASPVMNDLHLEDHGLQWTHAPTVLAHPRTNQRAVILDREIERTAACLEVNAPGDGGRYQQMMADWAQIGGPFVSALLRPFPPLRHIARLTAKAGAAGTADLARLSLLTVRRMMKEEFVGEAAGLLFAGNALHADFTPDTAGSALFGWLLVCLAQQYGFPVPVGGAASLTAALVRRAESSGVRIECGQRVGRIDIQAGRAVGVTTTDGTAVAATVVLADCHAQDLMLHLVGSERLSSKYLERIRRFQPAAATFKVDWALDRTVPWTDPCVREAGTVHIAESLDELTVSASQLAMGQVPDHPFLILGQMTTADPTRSPAGTESLWAYTHVPQHIRADAGSQDITSAWTETDTVRFAERIEQRIEEMAPGFTSRIKARSVFSPHDLERANANLVGGDINGGTAQLHQQLVFRPVSGMSRPETPIKGLFLASASAHPGGGVHGACGANAAHAAMLHSPLRRLIALGRSMETKTRTVAARRIPVTAEVEPTSL